MVEYGGFPDEHRQSLTTLIGTQAGTILGPVPPQMSYEITEVVVTSYGGTLSGRLSQFATLQGYSQYGTTVGTVVEPFQVSPGPAGQFIDGNGAAAIAIVDPGNILFGYVDAPSGTIAGSVQVKVVYRPIYQRGW
jgi:hypothetical protein